MKASRRIGRALWITASLLVAIGTLTPSGQPAVAGVFCVLCGDLAGVDLLWNVLAFVPIGSGLAFDGFRASRAVALAMAGSIVIEALQLFAIPGRDASIGDVIANSLGAMAGFALAAGAPRWLRPHSSRARTLSLAWLAIWLGMQAVGAFALRPDPSTGVTYHGQIGRAMSAETPFPGVVVRQSVNGDTLPDHVMSERQARRLREAMASAAPIRVDAVVVIDTPRPWRAPIVRIADRRENEILLLAAERLDLIASIRTRAARLRLRPLLYRLSNAWSPASGDTVQARAVFAASRVSLSTSSAGQRHRIAVPLTAASAWRLVAPLPVYAGGHTAYFVANGFWMFTAILPLGYWGRLASERDGTAGRLPLALLLTGVAIGAVAIPAMFGIAMFTGVELAASLAGVIAGAFLARFAR